MEFIFLNETSLLIIKLPCLFIFDLFLDISAAVLSAASFGHFLSICTLSGVSGTLLLWNCFLISAYACQICVHIVPSYGHQRCMQQRDAVGRSTTEAVVIQKNRKCLNKVLHWQESYRFKRIKKTTFEMNVLKLILQYILVMRFRFIFTFSADHPSNVKKSQ